MVKKQWNQHFSKISYSMGNYVYGNRGIDRKISSGCPCVP